MSVNSLYWIADDDDVYIPVKCIEDNIHTNNDEISFQLLTDSNKIIRRSRSSIVGELAPSFDHTVKGVPNDLVNSNDISEASILWSLKQRFLSGLIYTSIGPVIVAINPYRNIQGLYSAETLQLYTKSLEPDTSIASCFIAPPHIWTVARAAYVNLRANKTKQSIIVSGESGSGKTENTKKCLQYLSSVSLSFEKSSTGGQPIEERVLYTNPLLESFGNAKTVRNNNSSRFGKLISIDFIQNNNNGNLRLCGAHIISYLLEKSRVILHDNEERNYHIFYQMCSSPSMNLMKPENYNILNYGHSKVSGIDDTYDFSQTITAFQKLKFADTDRIAIFNVLKAILLLGNVEFEEITNDSCVSSKLSNDGLSILLEASELIGYDSKKIEYVLTQRTIVIPHQPPISVPLNQTQAIDVRNAFIKELYNRIFRFIVLKVNEALMFDERHTQKILSIGILDIFGFEIFEHNSFEQLCINYVNEKLQQFFIQYTIKKEIELYDSEGIHFSPVVPRDNIDILHLLENAHGGLFNIIDEETKIPKGSDEGFLTKALKHHHNKKHKDNKLSHEAHKMTATQFSIHHYAGQVTYDSSGFLNKNKDKLSDDAEDLFTHSNNEQINEIMTTCATDIAHPTHKKKTAVVGGKRDHSFQTLAMKLQEQLSHLMTDLKESEPHFVRCVKPNAVKAITIDNLSVLQQLRYSGTLEAIKIRKSGYPVRRSHVEFWQSYLGLTDYKRNAIKNYSDEEKCKFIISKIGKTDSLITEALVGKTMILFRSDVLMVLETKKATLIKIATSFAQKNTRRILSGRRFIKLNESRAKIKQLIQLGEQNNRSNVEVLQILKDTVTDADVNLQMHCFVLTEARNLIERLELVQDCIRKIEISLSPDSTSHFVDVIEEFHAIEEVQNLIVQLQIKTDATILLASKHALLADMVDCLKILRSAIKFKNHEDLVIALQKVNNLKKKQNCDFCAADETIGNNILRSLELEIITCENGVKLMQEFHVACIQTGTKTDSIVSFVAKYSGKNNKALILLIEPYVKEGSIFNSLAAMLIKGFSFVMSLQEKWSVSSWNEVYRVSKLLYDLVGSINDYNHPAPDRLVKAGAQFGLLFRSTISFLREPIELNVIKPLLQSCLLHGAIFFNENFTVIKSDLSDLAKNLERLPDMKVLGSYGPILAIVIPVVEQLFSIRECCINQNWLKVISLTHASEDREIFELMSHLPLDLLNKIGWSDSSQDDTNMYNLTVSNSLHQDFVHIADMINTEFEDSRHISINEFILTLISFAVKTIMMKGSFEDIVIDDATIVSFSHIDFLIDEIIKIEPSLRRTKVCETLLLQFKSLNQLMQLFSKRQLEEFIALHKSQNSYSSSELRALKVDAEIVSCMDTMISICSDLYNSVINYCGINSMMRAMREGCLTGCIGSISSTTCHNDSIEFCFENDIDRIKDKSPKLMQYIIIVRSLEQVRLEFLKENPSQILQQQKIEGLVKLIDGSPYNFNDYLELVLVRKHLMYILSKDMMMESLQLPPNPKYAMSLSNLDYDEVVDTVATTVDDENNSGLKVEGTKLLSRDGLILNYSLLETTKLSNVVEYALSVLKVTEGQEQIAVTIDELPEDFVVALHACELTLRLRSAALSGQFLEALEILEDAVKLNNPLLVGEIQMSAEIIITYAIVTIGQAVLHIPSPEIAAESGSNFKLRKLALDKLEIGYDKIITLEGTSLVSFLNSTSISTKAHVYICAIKLIYELRIAMRIQDWEAIDQMLKDFNEVQMKEKVLRLCGNEISLIMTALLNYRISKYLVHAAMEESLVLIDGVIERSMVSTSLLTKALKDAALVPAKNCCSELIFLQNIATVALNIRQGYIDRRLDIPEELLPSLIEEHNNLQAISRDISLVDPTNPYVTIVPAPLLSGFSLCIERDIHTIDNFHKLLAIEALLREECHLHGMKHEMIGFLDNHITFIKTDHISIVMEQLAEFSKLYTLSSATQKLSQNADFIVKMRRYLVKKDWDLLSNLLIREGQDMLTEFEDEILVVKIELVNSLFINDMFEALEDEQVLDIYELQNGHVKIAKLTACLNNCDEDAASMSSLATSLLHTGKNLLKLRSMLCVQAIDWYSIYISASNVIHDSATFSKIHLLARDELQTIYIFSREYYFCSAMTSSLSSGGLISTDDDIINVKNTDTKTLQTLISEIETFSPMQSQKGLVLFEASQNLLALREVFVEAFSLNALAINADANIDEDQIRVLVNHMEEIMMKGTGLMDSFPCADEVKIMAHHLHLVHVYGILVQSINENEYIYLCRSQVALPNISFLYDTNNDENDNVNDYSDEKRKVTLTIRALLEIEAYFNDHSLHSENAIYILEIVIALKQLRYSIIVNDWDECSRLLSDNDTHELLSGCVMDIGVANEYQFIAQELKNKQIMDMLFALIQKPTTAIDVNTLYDSVHDIGLIAGAVSSLLPTSVAANQLILSASNILLLRTAFNNNDSNGISEVLRWFKENTSICPSHCQQEAQHTYSIYQNKLLISGLKKAIVSNDTFVDSAIDSAHVTKLQNILDLARNVDYKSDEVLKLIEIASDILEMRLAQLSLSTSTSLLSSSSLSQLREAIGRLSTNLSDVLTDATLKEVAKAANELKYYELIKGLEQSIISFSFISEFTDVVLELSLQSLSRFIFDRQHDSGAYISEVDLNIDLYKSVLDKALAMCQGYLALPTRALKLKATVELLSSLRSSLSSQDFSAIESRLSSISFNTDSDNCGEIFQKRFDVLGLEEVTFYYKLISLRKSITNLNGSIADGQGDVGITGYYILSTIDVNQLDASINSLESDVSFFLDNYKSSSSSLTESPPSPTSSSYSRAIRHLLALIKSSRVLLKVRQSLKAHDTSTSRAIIEKYCDDEDIHFLITQRIKDYYIHGTTFDELMKLTVTLKNGISNKDYIGLEKRMNSINQIYDFFSIDLGQLKVLDTAASMVSVYQQITRLLAEIVDNYNREDIETVIFNAISIYKTSAMSSSSVLHTNNPFHYHFSRAESHLRHLVEFELLVSDLSDSNNGVITSKKSLMAILNLAKSTNMLNHPWSVRARTIFKLHQKDRLVYGLASALSVGSSSSLGTAAVITSRILMSTIKVNAKDDRYSLENYPVIKSEIRVILKRLSPSSSSSSSSLSPVSPSSLSSSFTLVADTSYRNDFNFLSQLISVFIRSIELNDTNSNDNLCRIVLLGKSSIRMRDEILIQILYRIRLYHCYNQNLDHDRLYRTLGACLENFPPSKVFEPYLSAFLFNEMPSQISQHFIRLMTSSVVRYGYSSIINDYNNRNAKDYKNKILAWITAKHINISIIDINRIFIDDDEY